MLDKTITSALCHLRLQLIRSGDSLHHVEALLVQRGIDPQGLHVPRQYPADRLRRGSVRVFILTALRDGSQRPCDVAAAFHAKHPELTYEAARRRVYKAADKLRGSGGIVGDGGVWRLAR